MASTYGMTISETAFMVKLNKWSSSGKLQRGRICLKLACLAASAAERGNASCASCFPADALEEGANLPAVNICLSDQLGMVQFVTALLSIHTASNQSDIA